MCATVESLEKKIKTVNGINDMLKRFEFETTSMVTVLSTFDEKLQKLETAVFPIYKESGSLQTKLKNAESLLTSLDQILVYYNTAKECETLIEQTNISNNPEEYFAILDKIVSAKEFFVENQLSAKDLQKIKNLFDRGIDRLEKEYKYILLQMSKPIPSHVTLDLINHEEEITSENVLPISNIPESSCKNLFKIATWLSSNAESPNFMTTYSQIRGDALMASLKALRDHLKSQSGSGSSLSTPSSFLSTSYRLSNYSHYLNNQGETGNSLNMTRNLLSFFGNHNATTNYNNPPHFRIKTQFQNLSNTSKRENSNTLKTLNVVSVNNPRNLSTTAMFANESFQNVSKNKSLSLNRGVSGPAHMLSSSGLQQNAQNLSTINDESNTNDNINNNTDTISSKFATFKPNLFGKIYDKNRGAYDSISANFGPGSNTSSGPETYLSSLKSLGITGDVDIEVFLTSMHGLLKLMQIEDKLIGICVPETLFYQCFGPLVQPVLESVITEGELITNAVHSAIKARDFSAVSLSIFPIYKYIILNIKPQMDTELLYCKPLSRQKFESFLDHMANVAYHLLEDYLECVRSSSANNVNPLGFGNFLANSSTNINSNSTSGHFSLTNLNPFSLSGSTVENNTFSGNNNTTTSTSTNNCLSTNVNYLPKDGIVHEITTNTCMFLENIADFVEIIGNILLKKDPMTYIAPAQNSMDHAKNNSVDNSRKYSKQSFASIGSETEPPRSSVVNNQAPINALKNVPSFESSIPTDVAARRAFSVYASRLLSTLGLNLRLKFEAYNDEALGSIFLINNFGYLLKFLQRNNGLRQIIKISTPKVEEYYEQQIQEFKRVYSQSWGKIVYYLSEKSGPNLPLKQLETISNIVSPSTSTGTSSSEKSANNAMMLNASFKLKERDRQAIKDKYSGFNREFSDIAMKHKKYFIVDPKIREIMRMETKAYILPMFREFQNRFKLIPFTKNPEKYFKYEVQDISDQIDLFFGGTE